MTTRKHTAFGGQSPAKT